MATSQSRTTKVAAKSAAVPRPRRTSADLACRRALALIIKANELLEELLDTGQIVQGSCPALTIEYLDEAIGMLTPGRGVPADDPQTDRERARLTAAVQS